MATLYERLGRYDGIAAVLDSLMIRMGKDSRLSRYFAGHGDDSKKRLRQLQMDMMCAAAGGPCFYTGRDMKTVHTGLGIDGADWMAMVSHVVGAMDMYHVPDEEQKAVLGLLNSLKKDIVEKP